MLAGQPVRGISSDASASAPMAHGTSAQRTTRDERSWTTRPLLRISCSPKQAHAHLHARSGGKRGNSRSGCRWSAAWPSPLGVVSEALPVDHDTGLTTDNPRVVAGWHDGKIPRAVLHLLPVVHDDLHPTGDEVAHMGSLTAVGL